MTTGMMVSATAAAVLAIAGQWKMLEKMGEKGWKALIPFYGEYLMFKHTWSKKAFWATVAALVVGSAGAEIAGKLAAGSAAILPVAAVGAVGCIAAVVLGIKAYHRIAKAFGHGTGYTLGLMFVEPVFDLILGFGKSEFAAA